MLVAVLLILAAVTVIVAVALVSMGRGGEMAEFPPDLPPLRLPDSGALTAADVVGVQLPMGLIGYHPASVDETLRRAGRALNDREARIAALERRLAELAAGVTPPMPLASDIKRDIKREVKRVSEQENAWFEEDEGDDDPARDPDPLDTDDPARDRGPLRDDDPRGNEDPLTSASMRPPPGPGGPSRSKREAS